MCCLQETYFRFKDMHRLKVKEWKRQFMQVETTKSKSSNTYIRQDTLWNKGMKFLIRVLGDICKKSLPVSPRECLSQVSPTRSTGTPNILSAQPTPASPPLCSQLLVHALNAAPSISPVNSKRKTDQDRWAREKPHTWETKERFPVVSLVSGKTQKRHKSLRTAPRGRRV